MEKFYIFENISHIAEVVTAIAAIWVAWVFYKWTKLMDEHNQSRQLNIEMQSFNQMVLADPKLLEIEARNRPPELGKIDLDDARKMYLYFCWVNMADNVVRARDEGLMEKSLADARLSSLSRVLAADSDFIKRHVLRDYPKLCV